MIVVEEKTVSRAKRIVVSALFMAGTTALLSGCGMIKNSICECARGYNVTYAAEGHEVFLNELGDDTYSLDIFKAPGVLESTMMIYGNAVHVIEKETFEVFTDGGEDIEVYVGKELIICKEGKQTIYNNVKREVINGYLN